MPAHQHPIGLRNINHVRFAESRALVHVSRDHLRAIRQLLARHVDRRGPHSVPPRSACENLADPRGRWSRSPTLRTSLPAIDGQRSKAAQAAGRLDGRQDARRHTVDGAHMARMCSGVVPAADRPQGSRHSAGTDEVLKNLGRSSAVHRLAEALGSGNWGKRQPRTHRQYAIALFDVGHGAACTPSAQKNQAPRPSACVTEWNSKSFGGLSPHKVRPEASVIVPRR